MKKVTIIIIAGGSASGKSTVASTIANDILHDESVIHLSMDSYYKNLSDISLEERKKVNYDHPNAIDVDLLCQHLDDLKLRKAIDAPIYDFNLHTQSGNVNHYEPSGVVILDGILALHIEEIRNRADIKLFIKTDDDIRFIRRLQRDVNDRGRSLESVVEQYLGTVRPMHKFFVEPSIDYADLIIPYYEGNNIAVDMVANKILNLVRDNEK
jgi:uridine kinase